MKRLSIAMVAACPFPVNHGTPAAIREMSLALAQRDHDVHVVTYPIKQDIYIEGLTVHRIGKMLSSRKVQVGPTIYKPLLDLLLILKLITVIRRHKIDIIHGHNVEGTLAGFFAGLITGKPVVYNAVNMMSDELPSYNFIRPKFVAQFLAKCIDHWVPRTGDFIITVSRELQQMIEKSGIPSEKIGYIPPGINLDLFLKGNPDRIRQQYGLGMRPVILYTGTLNRFQRIDYLLRAMQLVAAQNKEAMLLIAGNIIDPKDLKRQKKLAAELRIEDRIIFTQEHTLGELPDYLAAADVTVIPRPSCPGFPIKLLNYIAARKPVVTFEGSAKGLENAVHAMVISDGNWKSFGEAILSVLAEPELSGKLVENAYKKIEREFDLQMLARKVENVYYQLLSPSRRT